MNSRPRNLAEHAGTIHGGPDSRAMSLPANFAAKLNCRHRNDSLRSLRRREYLPRCAVVNLGGLQWIRLSTRCGENIAGLELDGWGAHACGPRMSNRSTAIGTPRSAYPHPDADP